MGGAIGEWSTWAPRALALLSATQGSAQRMAYCHANHLQWSHTRTTYEERKYPKPPEVKPSEGYDRSPRQGTSRSLKNHHFKACLVSNGRFWARVPPWSRDRFCQICLQKAPGQDLAQNGCFPMLPESACTCRLASDQNPQIWLQKAPGQDLPHNARFPLTPRLDHRGGNLRACPKP